MRRYRRLFAFSTDRRVKPPLHLERRLTGAEVATVNDDGPCLRELLNSKLCSMNEDCAVIPTPPFPLSRPRLQVSHGCLV